MYYFLKKTYFEDYKRYNNMYFNEEKSLYYNSVIYIYIYIYYFIYNLIKNFQLKNHVFLIADIFHKIQ